MRTFIILFLFTNSYLAQGQLIDKSKFDRLVIVDEYNSNYNIIYGRIYKLDLHDSLPKLILTSEYKSPDTLHSLYQGKMPKWDKIENRKSNEIVSVVDPQLVDTLIQTLNRPKTLGTLLGYYGMDSTWHRINKERLIQQWLVLNETRDKIEKEYAKYILSNFQQFGRMAYYHILQTNTSEYSSVTIAFENDTDTLMIHSTGQESFLIPWSSETTYKNYDPRLSALVSKFLPDDITINKRTLSPTQEEFEEGILRELSFKVYFFNRKEFKKFQKRENR